MSGPVFILTPDLFNGVPLNFLPINGMGGEARLFAGPGVDSRVFDLYIGGKLRLKEKVCGIKNAPRPKGKQVQDLVPVCDKVKP